MKIIASLTAVVFVFGMATPSLAADSPDEVLISSITSPTEPAPFIPIGEDSTATATMVPATTKTAPTNEDASSSLRGSRTSHTNDYDIFLKSDHYKCLTFYPSDSYYARIATCDVYDDYQYLFYEHHTHYIKCKHTGWCLTYDIHHHDRYIGMAPCNGGSNQKWYYNDKDWRFRSYYDHYCMDHCRDCGGYVHAKACDAYAGHDQEYLVGHSFF